MSGKPCSRLWQVEAVLDRALSRADSASFERHAATCVECSAERATLMRLASVARRMRAFEVAPLRRRALHHQLLRRANELAVGTRPSPLTRLRVGVATLACLLGLLVLLFSRFVGQRSQVAGSGIAPVFELVAAPNSRWHVKDPGSSLRLALESGVLTISVHKLTKAQRFALSLPDGELEVRGTRFTVECDREHTRRVAVEEGRVALRLAGRPEVSLGPGQAWPPEQALTPAPSAPLAPSSSIPPSSPPSSKAELAREVRRPSAPSRAAPRTANVSAPVPSDAAAVATPSAAARDFAEAMTVFSHGDFGTAERLFRAFEQRYPQNPHVEDVLFLRALGRARRGDASGARVLAREYLRRYPGGFRAVEAQEMTRDPAPRASLGANPELVTFP